MNTDVEDLLRQGMERFTADLRAPAGMTRRAVRRQRRRRLAVRSVAGVAAALTAGAVAVVAAGVPGARGTGTEVPATTAAYVVQRVDSALSAAEPVVIAQMTIATSRSPIPGTTATTTTAEEWSYGSRWRSVRNSPAGHPVYDLGSSASSVYTVVDYQTRTWARQSGAGSLEEPKPGSRGCATILALPWAVLPGTSPSSGSLRERAELIGGTLRAGTTPTGFRVELEVPS